MRRIDYVQRAACSLQPADDRHQRRSSLACLKRTPLQWRARKAADLPGCQTGVCADESIRDRLQHSPSGYETPQELGKVDE